MKKSFKKFGVIVLALAMIFALTVPAMADNDNVYKGSNQTEATSFAGNNAIPLNKTVVIFNTDDNTQVREPDITFSYAIAIVDSSAAEGAQLSSTVSDGTNTVRVYNGVMGGAVTNPNNIVYSHSNSVAATTKGFEDEKTTDIGVDPTLFPHAGIFRYVITESSSVTPQSVGMEEHTGNYDATRYLDIYIYNPDYDAVTNPSGHTNLWMAGAVLFKNTTTSGGTAPKDAITTTTEKTTGFEPGEDGTPGTTDFTNDETVDRYFTYNLKVTKKITGTLADAKHDFPFEIKVRDSLTHGIEADFDYTTGGAAYDGSAPATFTVTSTDYVLKPKMSDGEFIIIKGLPKGTTVDVKEKNDTVDEYKYSTAFTAGTTSTATVTTPTALSKTGFVGEEAIKIDSNSTTVKADKTTEVIFTNDLDEISITGITLRVAPFAAMAGAGVLFLAISKKSKKEEEEE